MEFGEWKEKLVSLDKHAVLDMENLDSYVEYYEDGDTPEQCYQQERERVLFDKGYC